MFAHSHRALVHHVAMPHQPSRSRCGDEPQNTPILAATDRLWMIGQLAAGAVSSRRLRHWHVWPSMFAVYRLAFAACSRAAHGLWQTSLWQPSLWQPSPQQWILGDPLGRAALGRIEVACGPHRSLSAVTDADVMKDAREVCLDRTFGDAEAAGNHLVGQAIAHILEHFELAG